MFQISSEQIDLGMRVALDEASRASDRGEVPIGASILSSSMQVIASAGNRVEELRDPTAHAELLCIRAASHALGQWRLEDCVLFATLEPCTMCTGALRNARIGAIVFGAFDSRAGAMGSLYDISLDERLGKIPRVISGIKSSECAELLKNFFSKLR